MSVSNLVAIRLAWSWSLLPISPTIKFFTVLVTLIMVFLRQKACWKYLIHGPYASHASHRAG
jgi:hypothetical protein